MRRLGWLTGTFLLLAAGTSGISTADVNGDCDSMDSCLSLLAKPETQPRKAWETNIQPGEDALAKKIQAYGSPAIPRLLELLKDPHPVIRDRAGYTLRDIDGLTAADLPVLMVAADAGNGWIPAAIGKIGTPQAVDFLIKEVHENPEVAKDSQISWGLQRMQPAPVSRLLAELKCKQACDKDYLEAIAHILGDMPADAKPAASVVAAIVADKSLSMDSRRGALSLLEDLKPHEDAVARIVAEAATEPQLHDEALEVLVAMQNKAALPYLLAEAQQADGMARQDALYSIAYLGVVARDEGPQILPYLDDPDWDVRVETAAALGSIGYTDADTALMQRLKGPDWRLTYESVRGLGMLHDKDARTSLEDISKHHWSKAVREEAVKAMSAIDKGAPMEQRRFMGGLSGGFEDLSVASDGLSAQTEVGRCMSQQVFWQGKHVTIDDAERIWPVPAQRPTFPMPDYTTGAFPLDSGWLIGRDAGEFGGGLYFYDLAGNKTALMSPMDENIHGIYRVGGVILAVGGLAHMTLDHGRVYRLDRAAGGSWTVTPLVELPSAPFAVGVLDSDHLVIDSAGGAVAVDGSGGIEALECVK